MLTSQNMQGNRRKIDYAPEVRIPQASHYTWSSWTSRFSPKGRNGKTRCGLLPDPELYCATGEFLIYHFWKLCLLQCLIGEDPGNAHCRKMGSRNSRKVRNDGACHQNFQHSTGGSKDFFLFYDISYSPIKTPAPSFRSLVLSFVLKVARRLDI